MQIKLYWQILDVLLRKDKQAMGFILLDYKTLCYIENFGINIQITALFSTT